MKLNKRLSAVAELVRIGSSVCDVGTDHAYLACYLAESGKFGKIYACDLNLEPLKKAEAEIKRQNVNVILLQSDGLEKIPPCDDVVIAGMGGELIADIVEKCPFKSTIKSPSLRVIVQPMTRHEEARKGLCKSGFEIVCEKIVRENNRLFVIICAEYTASCKELDDFIAYFGVSQNQDYVNNRLEMLRKKAMGDRSLLELIAKAENWRNTGNGESS